MSQKQQVLNHMTRHGTITPMQAYSVYKITCLAERIRDLRDGGHKIASEMVRANGKRFARYSLIKTRK